MAETENKTQEKVTPKPKAQSKSSKKNNIVGVTREYVIPLRDKIRVVPRYKKTNKAIKTIKEFLAKHMQVRDRDLDKIKLDTYLNEQIWSRGIKNPQHKVKVKATKDDKGIVSVELAEPSAKLKFKKIREEKIIQKASEAGNKKPVKEEAPAKDKKEDAEKKADETEKKSAVVEAGEKIEKAAAKQVKHSAKDKASPSRNQQRKSLAR